MPARIARRKFIAASTAATALAALPSGPSRAALASVEILETKVISQDGRFYNGWPTVCRRANGQLVVTCSGGREGHVCPFGRVEMMTSDDEGKSWSYAQQINGGRPDGRLVLNKMRTRDTISRELRAAAPGLGVGVAGTVIRDLQAYRDAAQRPPYSTVWDNTGIATWQILDSLIQFGLRLSFVNRKTSEGGGTA